MPFPSISALRATALVCVLIGVSAQTPAPSASPAKPLRHLEYGFSVGVQGLQNYALKGGTGVQTVDKSGNVASPEGGSGTMYVDILSVAPDGALVVQIAEQAVGDPRPRQAFTCNVYGNTSVLCPSMPSPSEAEWVLLAYLGRQFVDGAPWNAQGQWQRHETSDQFDTTEDFTLVDASKVKAVVHETKKMVLHNGGFDNQTSDVTITYDRAREVPDVIHDDVVTTGGDEASNASYEFSLKRDSYAKSPPHAPR